VQIHNIQSVSENLTVSVLLTYMYIVYIYVSIME